MIFTWDAAKNRINKKKHGVSFEEAESVFLDEHARLIGDPDHSDSENRFVLLGISVKLKLLVVVHVYRESNELIRIISARKATTTERKFYKRG
ncbi:MAG: BrnT family toxin [Bdellovibrionales bacterium]|nr:BrnT family toxin [Bdellovibrionales bacterium]